jgi:hypothetical protein
MKFRSIFFLILFSFNFIPLVEAQKWSDETIGKLTAYMHEYKPSWSIDKTKQLLQDSESTLGEYHYGEITDKGNLSVTIMEDSILINGKD